MLSAHTAKGGEYINRVGLSGHYEGVNHHGVRVVLNTVRQLELGEVVDLTPDIEQNAAFFRSSPGYSAKEHDTSM